MNQKDPNNNTRNNQPNDDSGNHPSLPVFPQEDRPVFQTGTSACYLYDIRKDMFINIDESILDITGISASEFTEKTPLETLGEVTEFSHLEAIQNFVTKSIGPSMATAEEYPVTVNLIYNIVSRDNVQRRVHTKYIFTDFENNFPLYTKGVSTDITHIQKDGLPVFFLMQNNKLILREVPDPDEILKKSSIPLSRAEINVLRYSAKGMAPKEIARVMKISLSTLYTHRKNIKNKMKKDINLIISMLREKGFIS